MIVTRLEMEDTYGKTFNIFMVSAYAPTGETSADLITEMQKCIDAFNRRIYRPAAPTPTHPVAPGTSKTIRSSLVATKSADRTERHTRTKPPAS
jgi:hypothetical protein